MWKRLFSKKKKEVPIVVPKPVIKECKTVRKMIIVDDVEIMTRTMKDYYKLKGFEVEILCATSGEECIQLCKEHEDIDLIFMDLIMNPMDGYTASEIILNTSNIMIIALSGMIDCDSIQRCKNIGITDIFEKPVNYISILDKIKKHGLEIK